MLMWACMLALQSYGRNTAWRMQGWANSAAVAPCWNGSRGRARGQAAGCDAWAAGALVAAAAACGLQVTGWWESWAAIVQGAGAPLSVQAPLRACQAHTIIDNGAAHASGYVESSGRAVAQQSGAAQRAAHGEGAPTAWNAKLRPQSMPPSPTGGMAQCIHISPSASRLRAYLGRGEEKPPQALVRAVMPLRVGPGAGGTALRPGGRAGARAGGRAAGGPAPGRAALT